VVYTLFWYEKSRRIICRNYYIAWVHYCDHNTLLASEYVGRHTHVALYCVGIFCHISQLYYLAAKLTFMYIVKLIGAIGLVLISVGIIIKKRKTQDILYIIGGLCLEVYSLYIGDIVFIILQIVFTLTAIYNLSKVVKKK